MLCNVDYVNWKPDLLWFDNHRILKTSNYYVQNLFMNYQGTEELAFSMEGQDEILPLMERERLDMTGRETEYVFDEHSFTVLIFS